MGIFSKNPRISYHINMSRKVYIFIFALVNVNNYYLFHLLRNKTIRKLKTAIQSKHQIVKLASEAKDNSIFLYPPAAMTKLHLRLYEPPTKSSSCFLCLITMLISHKTTTKY